MSRFTYESEINDGYRKFAAEILGKTGKKNCAI